MNDSASNDSVDNMKLAQNARVLVLCSLVAIASLQFCGCGAAAPTDKVTEEKQLKELDQARQREWKNE